MPSYRPWWHSAAVYQVYPRSFADSDGDGLGDLPGVISRLDYLARLGVDALWLSPFYPSPGKDAGYDVADPRAVDPAFGTMADAVTLIEQSHARGLRVIVDVVPNHTSSDRAWFREALASAPGSPARARYHFRDGRGPDGDEPPNNWISWFGGSAWERVVADGRPGQWYLHTFDSSQPDLNWSNPEVVADGLETLRFWLDLGVDGFRVDVALGLCKDMTYPDLDDPESLVLAMRADLDDGSEESMRRRRKVVNSPVLDRDEVQDIYRGWRALMDSYSGDRMAVCEAWLPPERAARYVAHDTLHQIFNFDFMGAPWDVERVRSVIEATYAGLAAVGAPATWSLSNHDTLRPPTRLGGGTHGLRRARAMALVAHVLPGSVYVYNGEELGLADVDLPDAARQDPVFFRTAGAQKGRDGARVPLPWSGDEPPYGFSSASTTWLPMPDGWAGVTVEHESADPASTLAQYRRMLALRHRHPAFDETDVEVEVLEDVLVVRRGSVACVVNFAAEPRTSPVDGVRLVTSDPGVDATWPILPPASGAWVESAPA
ncbi:MAG: glycoside hydrolase family 13 protein [Candidatus Nanopelagicales bacterium]